MSEARAPNEAEIEAQVERVYAEEIAPHLSDPKAEQLEHASKIKQHVVILILLAAGLAGVLQFVLPIPFAMGIAIFGLGGLGVLHFQSLATQRSQTRKNRIIPPLCRLIGNLEYRSETSEAVDFEGFMNLGVVEVFNTSASILEDLFVGSHRGIGFRMVEADLQTGGKYSGSVFRGLLFEIEVPSALSGRILIARDQGDLSNRFTGFIKKHFSSLHHVAFDDPQFERQFQVYSDDAAEARRLISPSFQDTMVVLTKQASSADITAAFADGKFLLALPGEGNLFEFEGLADPPNEIERRLKGLVRQIMIAHRLIDYLHGERPGLMP